MFPVPVTLIATAALMDPLTLYPPTCASFPAAPMGREAVGVRAAYDRTHGRLDFDVPRVVGSVRAGVDPLE